jgi:predicted RND superfamily exporter protein
MWHNIATFVLRNRFWLLISLGILTVGMVYFATKVQLTYDFAKLVPDDDPDFIEYVKFKETFGEDGNILPIGIQSDKLYQKDFFNDLVELNKRVESIDGVEKVLSIANIYMPSRNDEKHELEIKPLITEYVKTDAEMDSVKQLIMSMPLYKGILYNEKGDVALLAVTLNKKKLDSKERIALVQMIEKTCNEFGVQHDIKITRVYLMCARFMHQKWPMKLPYLPTCLSLLRPYLYFYFLDLYPQ